MAAVDMKEGERHRRRQDSSERRIGRALAEALREGNRLRDQQDRFRSYLNAHAVAADLINALTRYPGFVEIEQQKVMFKMTEVTKAVTRARNWIAKQLSEQHDIQIKDPAHVAQITRLASEAVIRQWGDDGRLFDRLPNGDSAPNDETRMVLTTMYVNFVTNVVDAQDLKDEAGESSVDDEGLDRVLAAYSVFLRIDDAVKSFYALSIGQNEDLDCLLFGKSSRGEIVAPDEMTHRIADLIVFPMAKEREQAVMETFDPAGQFSGKERRVTYRAMLNHISRDIASVIEHEGQALVNRVLVMNDGERSAYESDEGLLIDWLANRVRKRLDRLYPQPYEYVDRRQEFASSGRSQISEKLRQARQHRFNENASDG